MNGMERTLQRFKSLLFVIYRIRRKVDIIAFGNLALPNLFMCALRYAPRAPLNDFSDLLLNRNNLRNQLGMSPNLDVRCVPQKLLILPNDLYRLKAGNSVGTNSMQINGY